MNMNKIITFLKNKVWGRIKRYSQWFTIQPLYRLYNIYLKIRFMLFKKYLTKKDFSVGKELIFSDDFKNLDNFTVKNNEFYNNNNTWFSKDAVSITDEGVSIKCFKDKATHTSWQGTRETDWTSGMIDTRDTFLASYGTWVFNAKICDSWLAIWLLKRDYHVPNINVAVIIPEIDVLEIIKHRVRHTIHYGYSNTVYRKYGIGSSLFKNDNKFHEFAVELLKKGYNFYIDGILTAKFISNDPEFVTDEPNFLLLNNAGAVVDIGVADKKTNADTDFIVKSVKFYK